MMNRNFKLLLMFTPLALLFFVLSVVVNDLRHPETSQDYCKVTAVGMEAAVYRPSGHYIYKQSENPLHDVSLQCSQSGPLMLNDLQLRQTPVQKGQDAEIKHKRFQFLPERWAVSVHTGPEKKVTSSR
jgi:hypothetical protein